MSEPCAAFYFNFIYAQFLFDSTPANYVSEGWKLRAGILELINTFSSMRFVARTNGTSANLYVLCKKILLSRLGRLTPSTLYVAYPVLLEATFTPSAC